MVDQIRLIQIGIIISLFILSALPLHRAVKTVKGRTTLLKTIIIILFSALIFSIIHIIFKVWGDAISFIALIFVYKKAFKLAWFKAFMVWALHLAFIIAGAIIIEFFLSILFKISVLI